jgi:hypothetical protein
VNLNIRITVGLIATLEQAATNAKYEPLSVHIDRVNPKICDGFEQTIISRHDHGGWRVWQQVTATIAHDLKREIAIAVSHETTDWATSELIDLLATFVFLVDRDKPPSPFDLSCYGRARALEPNSVLKRLTVRRDQCRRN